MNTLVDLSTVVWVTGCVTVVICGLIIIVHSVVQKRRLKKLGPLHDFDLQNPMKTVLEVSVRTIVEGPEVLAIDHPQQVTLTRFVCRRCGRSLDLSREEMNRLPPEWARGCFPKEDEGNKA